MAEDRRRADTQTAAGAKTPPPPQDEFVAGTDTRTDSRAAAKKAGDNGHG